MAGIDWIAIIALIVALIGTAIALMSYRSSQRTAMLQVNLDLILKGNEQLGKNINLLGLHGVDEIDVKKLNISEAEFLYILNSFYAGQAFYYIKQPFCRIKLSEYRKKMLENPKVEATWKEVIRPNLIGETSYVKAIDKFYAQQKPE